MDHGSKNLSADITIHSPDGEFLSPRRIRLLLAIEEHGSIIRAAKALPMSYRNAWESVQEMNRLFSCKLVDSDKQTGSYLTSSGKSVIALYRGLQRACRHGIAYMNGDFHDYPSQRRLP